MIDWITALVPIRAAHQLRAGEITCCDGQGEVEWVTAKRKLVRGSNDEQVSVKRVRDREIEFSGCPAKFLQGHNVFGSDNLIGVGAEMILRVCRSAGIELLDSEVNDIRAGRYTLLRVDINYSFATGSRVNVHAWIKKAATVATLRHRGHGQKWGSTTAMWGGKSRYWTLKAYAKGAALAAKNHELPAELPMRGELHSWSADKLRLEVSLKARYLKKLGLDRAALWHPGKASKVFQEHLSRLNLGGNVVLTPDDLQTLPYHLRPTYSSWWHGVDVRPLMSRSKYHRHHKALLDLGINIAVPQGADALTTVPLGRYLEAPVVVPQWARDGGCVSSRGVSR